MLKILTIFSMKKEDLGRHFENLELIFWKILIAKENMKARNGKLDKKQRKFL
jgi:hypothetical protein